MICLLFGTAHPALGAEDDLEYLVKRLREVWPDVRIMLRADSGFGVPKMYAICERLEIDYTIGIGMNPTLKKCSDPLLEHCIEEFDEKDEAQRKFAACWYKAGSWAAQRWVVIKCEVRLGRICEQSCRGLGNTISSRCCHGFQSQGHSATSPAAII